MDDRVTAVAENAHEQVFGADRLMPPVPRLLGGKHHHSPGTLGEPLQHVGLRSRSEWTRTGTTGFATELTPEKDNIGRLPSQRAIKWLRVPPDIRDQDAAASSSNFRLNVLDEALPDSSASSFFGDDEFAEVRPKPEVMGTGKADDPGVVFPDDR
jgi:hypothetical protein